MGKITYKIDRIVSSSGLELGLKTGATLTGSATGITTAKPLFYATDIDSNADANTLVNKKYVTSAIGALETSILGHLGGNHTYITEGDGISVTAGGTTAAPTQTIALAAMSSRPTDNVFGYAISDNTKYHEGSSGKTTDSKEYISGLKIDNYGRIIGVYNKQIDTADLHVTSGVDNYVQWNLKVGNRVFGIGSGNTAATASNPIKEYAASPNAAQTSIINLILDGSNGITVSSEQNTVTFGFNYNSSDLEYADSKIGLKSRTGVEQSTSGLYNLTINNKGIITAASAVNYATITSNLTAHNGTTSGIVKKIVTSGTGQNTGTTSIDTYFYTSTGTWNKIDWNKVAVASATASGTFAILGAADSNANTTAVKSAATIDKDGNIVATKITANGSALTNLNASNISSGTINKAYLPEADIKDMIIPTDFNGTGNVVISASGTTLTSLANPTAGSGTTIHYVLSSTGSTPQWENITNLVQGIVAGEGGMIFKGLIKAPTTTYKDGDEHDGYIYGLPNGTSGKTFTKGWFYRVAESGIYTVNGNSDVHLEVGDAIYAVANSSDAGTIKWGILEKNIDHAIVAGTNSTPRTNIVIPIKTADVDSIYDGFSATVDNGAYTLTASVTGNAATATKLAASKTLWGKSFDGSANVSGDISSTGNITPSSNNISSVGSASNKYANMYATTFNGNLSGNATSADKVNHTLTFTGLTGGDKTFDGSADQSISLSAADIGGIDTVTITPSGTGNVVTGFDTSTVSGTTITLKPILGSVVSSISSSIFSVGTGQTPTISWLSSATDGAFYSGTFNSASHTTNLNFGGVLKAKNLMVYRGSSTVDVAKMIANVGVANTILVNDDNQDSTGKAGFKSSGISIETSIQSTYTQDKTIATSKAVKTYVDNTVSSSVSNTMKVAKATYSANSPVESATIPASAIIDHIDVYVTDAYASAANITASIKIGNIEVIGGSSANPIALDDSDGDLFSYKFGYPVSGTAAKCNITLTNATASTPGSGVIYVYYNTL